jgi:sporulation protein YqfC
MGDLMNYKSVIDNYFDDEKIKIVFYDNQIYIDNYQDLSNFDSKKIIIKGANIIVEIEGEKLVISKLLDKELLIIGKINKIGFINNGE